jgi:hypothetical protein
VDAPRDGGSAERDIAVGPDDGLLIGGWLPDGSGIIATWGVGEERPHSWVQLLDGTTRRLAVDADAVQAVLPSDFS